MDSGQIKVWGTNNSKAAIFPFNSKDSYACANAAITKGLTSSPPSLENCFDRFPFIKQTAEALGVTLGSLWTGPYGASGGGASGATYLLDVYFDKPSNECIEVATSPNLGKDWLGCLWGSPGAPFSCICPEYGPKFDSYLKLRQNVATFWYTNSSTPVKRQEFLDALQFGPKLEIVTSGDFKYQLGTVAFINVNGISKNPNKQTFSTINGYYWIVGIKHVITNSGTHETRLMLSQMAVDSPY